MKNIFKITAIVFFMSSTFLNANEGMWLVSLLNKMNKSEMKGIGLNLTK